MTTGRTAELSSTHYLGVQLAMLSTGLGTLLVAHTVTRRVNDSVTGATPATVMVLMLVVPLAVAAVARSTFVIVTAGHSDAHRVFRCRHLLLTGALLLVVGVTTIVSMVVHDPFAKLFAHGRITSEDMVDAGFVAAALICMFGAGVAFTGAWDRLHAERHWHRSLHLHIRRDS